MFILSNVFIEVEKDYIMFIMMNLDLGICCKIKVEVKEFGFVMFFVKCFVMIVCELLNVDVVFDVLFNYQVKLVLGGFNFKIMGIGKEEFFLLLEFGDEKFFIFE